MKKNIFRILKEYFLFIKDARSNLNVEINKSIKKTAFYRKCVALRQSFSVIDIQMSRIFRIKVELINEKETDNE